MPGPPNEPLARLANTLARDLDAVFHGIGDLRPPIFPERVERMRAETERDAQARWSALPDDRRALIDSIVGTKADARRAYRRARKADADSPERAAALEEQRRLKEKIGSEKMALRERRAKETEVAVGA